VALDNYNGPALYNLGNAYYMKGFLDKSINSYLLALKLNPDSAECHFNLATAYNDNADQKQAQEHFETSLKHNPHNADCLYELGRLQQRRGAVNIEKAEDYFKRALKIDPAHKKAIAALKQI
jgi:tetratricopeptide (TPR) repeat protein